MQHSRQYSLYPFGISLPSRASLLTGVIYPIGRQVVLRLSVLLKTQLFVRVIVKNLSPTVTGRLSVT